MDIERGFARIADVSRSKMQLEKNSTDASGISSKPLLVVYPRDEKQVLEIVRLAIAEKITIVPRGGGSGLCGGATANGAVVVNLTRMKRVLGIGKNFVITEPGIILDDLNKILGKRGLFMPVQPASHDLATIGGMIATNAGGEHVLRFGRMMDNILSLKVVTGKGDLITISKSKIADFCGVEGLSGIIVGAKLRVLPKIRNTSITVREVPGIEEMMGILSTKKGNPIAAEFIGPTLYSMMGKGEKYFLLLEYAGKAGEITEQKKIERYWRLREGCFGFLARRGWHIIADPQLPGKKIAKFLNWCDKNRLPAFGHIGHGIMHVHFRNKASMDRMYRFLASLGGVASGEHGYGIVKKKYLAKKRRNALRRLKKIYDPGDILNPGKVI